MDTRDAQYLRDTAAQCRSFARWHTGAASDYLQQLALEFETAAAELERSIPPGGARPRSRRDRLLDG